MTDLAAPAADLAAAHALLAGNAFAGLLRITLQVDGAGLYLAAPVSGDAVGNSMLGAAHGGVLVTLLELAGECVLLGHGHGPVRVVDSTCDYLRPAVGPVLHARAQVQRVGRRVASAALVCWADDPARPVAAGRANYRLGGVDAPGRR